MKILTHIDNEEELVTLIWRLTHNERVRKHIALHKKKGAVRIMRDDDGVIAGVAMFIMSDTQVSLSTYWVREDIRRTSKSFFFFMNVFPHFGQREILVKAKDISTFKTYCEPTSKKDVYRLVVGKGLNLESINSLLDKRNG